MFYFKKKKDLSLKLRTFPKKCADAAMHLVEECGLYGTFILSK